MDTIDSPTLFLLNILMAVVLATMMFGYKTLILFGLVMAPTLIVLLGCLFYEAGTGVAPLSLLYVRLSRSNAGPQA